MPPTNELHIPDNIEHLTLPLFNEPLDPRTNQVPTEEIEVNRGLTVLKLRDILKDYGLPRSGNRPALIKRLWQFSQDKGTWISQYRAAPGRQRGDISSQRSAKTETARVIEQQFGARVKASTYQPKRVGRAKDLRDPPALGDSVVMAFDSWASGVNKRVGEGLPLATSSVQIPEPMDTSAGGAGADGEAGIVSEPNKGPSSSMFAVRRVENRVASITQILGNMQTQLSMIGSAVMAPAHSDLLSSVAPSPHIISAPTNCASGVPLLTAATGSDLSSFRGQVHPLPPPPPQPTMACYLTLVPPVAESEIPSSDLRFCDLLPGEPFPFDRRRVPDPPPVSFSDNLSQLFREWYQSNLLMVNGHGIPIRHWPWFYKKKTNIRTDVWSVIRMKWAVWKFLVKEYERLGTEAAFWEEHSDKHGNRHNFKRICNDLKLNRKDNSERDADAALEYFHNDLSHSDAHGYFIYKRSGQTFIMTKPDIIARKWRKLLADHPEVAKAWAATQPDNSEEAEDDVDIGSEEAEDEVDIGTCMMQWLITDGQPAA